MTAQENIEIIQNEKMKELEENGIPELNAESADVMAAKRMSLDEPPAATKKDPMR